MLQVLPITNAPNQTLVASLTVDGSSLELGLSLRYNESAGYWVLGIYNRDGTPLLNSIPLVTAGNILAPYHYLKIGALYVVNASGISSPDYPNRLNLGTDFALVWGDTPPSA